MVRRLLIAVLVLVAARQAAAARFSLATIPVGEGAGRILAAPEIGHVFVAIASDDMVTRRVIAIRVADDTISATFDVGTRPNVLAFDPDRQQLLVAGPGRIESYAFHTFGLTTTASLTNSIEVEQLHWPLAAVWDGEHDRLLVTDTFMRHVGSVDGATFTFTEGTAVADRAVQILVGPKLVLPSGRFSVITELNAGDLSEGRVLRGVGRSVSAAYSPSHDRVYSVDQNLSWLGVADFAAGTDTYIAIGDRPWSIAADEVNDRLYIGYCAPDSRFVTRVDSATLSRTDIPVLGPARTLVLDSAKSLLYAADLDNSQVSVIDTGSAEVVATLPTGKTPGLAALDPRSHKLYLSNKDSGTVTRVSPGVAPGAGESEVTAVPEVIAADHTSRSLVTVLPRDEDGLPLGPGHQVVILASAGTLIPPVADQGDGRYTQELVSTDLTETAIVSAVVDGQTLGTRPRVSFHRDGWVDLRESLPEWGLTSGGTLVTLNGTGFIDGITAPAGAGAASFLQVWFGAERATIVSASDGEIVCTTPAHAAGVVDVSVVKFVGDERRESFLRGGYTYVEDENLNLTVVKGETLGEVSLTWSNGPSGPVRLLQSPHADFSAGVTTVTDLRGPSTSEFPPYTITYYRVER